VRTKQEEVPIAVAQLWPLDSATQNSAEPPRRRPADPDGSLYRGS
jgi:hypothetical protein